MLLRLSMASRRIKEYNIVCCFLIFFFYVFLNWRGKIFFTNLPEQQMVMSFPSDWHCSLMALKALRSKYQYL